MEGTNVVMKQNNYELEVSRGTLEVKGFKNNNHFLPGTHRKQINDTSADLERVTNYFKEFKNHFNDDIFEAALLRESIG